MCNRQSVGFKRREIKIYYKSNERGNAKTWIPVKSFDKFIVKHTEDLRRWKSEGGEEVKFEKKN
jgi:hypothetical protein